MDVGYSLNRIFSTPLCMPKLGLRLCRHGYAMPTATLRGTPVTQVKVKNPPSDRKTAKSQIVSGDICGLSVAQFSWLVKVFRYRSTALN